MSPLKGLSSPTVERSCIEYFPWTTWCSRKSFVTMNLFRLPCRLEIEREGQKKADFADQFSFPHPSGIVMSPSSLTMK